MCSRKLPLWFWLSSGDLGYEASWRYFQGAKFVDDKWKLLAGYLRINVLNTTTNRFLHIQRF